MAKRSQQTFLKRQKEIKRKEEAAEKMARRHGRTERPMNGVDEIDIPLFTDEKLAPVTDTPG
jgi:hypothetical protein